MIHAEHEKPGKKSHRARARSLSLSFPWPVLGYWVRIGSSGVELGLDWFGWVWTDLYGVEVEWCGWLWMGLQWVA